MSPSQYSDGDFRRFLDTAPDAIIVVDERGRISIVNLQAEQLFGYLRAELLGQSLDLLIPHRYRGGHADHVTRFFAHPQTRAMGSGLELFGRKKDGSEVPVEVSLSPVDTASGPRVSAAIRDITVRKQMEAAAKLNSARLTDAVESSQDALALFDASLRLVLCNSAYRRLLSASPPGALIGRTYDELADELMRTVEFRDDAERERFRKRRHPDAGADRGSADFRTKDGYSLRANSRRTVEGGIVETIWDLTEDVRREQELREARSAAEAASSAKSEFLSSMSHELRTPLNAILGFAQLLQRDKKEPLSPRHRERAEQILRGGEHLLRLIDDILDLARIEAGSIAISNEPVRVAEVLDEVRTTLSPAAARAGVELEVRPIPAAAAVVVADRTRLAQILMNFGSNAIKYNRAGGNVAFGIDAREERVRITVADTGIGIPEDKQHKLFQPFQRAGQETGPIEGTGIGLVITKRLAELMGGSVGFQSWPARGSEFWVELRMPPAKLRPSTPPAELSESSTASFDSEQSAVVLYVEDNPANIAFMRDLLGSFDNVGLLTAGTAEMGIELARARQPDVILMDINLPGMSGLDALRVLSSDAATARIPVIALTAAASERDRLRGIQAGFFQYLTKPVKVDALLAALEAILEKGASA